MLSDSPRQSGRAMLAVTRCRSTRLPRTTSRRARGTSAILCSLPVSRRIRSRANPDVGSCDTQLARLGPWGSDPAVYVTRADRPLSGGAAATSQIARGPTERDLVFASPGAVRPSCAPRLVRARQQRQGRPRRRRPWPVRTRVCRDPLDATRAHRPTPQPAAWLGDCPRRSLPEGKVQSTSYRRFAPMTE